MAAIPELSRIRGDDVKRALAALQDDDIQKSLCDLPASDAPTTMVTFDEDVPRPQERYALMFGSDRPWGYHVALYAQAPAAPGSSSNQPFGDIRALADRVAASEASQRRIAGDVAQILSVLNVVEQELKAVHKEVDRPLISDLWFGFVSDRFTTVLNRMLGFDSGPSTPLWAAGFLSLGLLVLRTLLFFLNRYKADSTVAKLLGPMFGVIVSVYLVVLTGSLFMLATSAPGSPIESYTEQIEASDKLTKEMRTVSGAVENLRSRLNGTSSEIDSLTETIRQATSSQVGLTEKTQPATVAAIERIDRLSTEQLPALAILRAEVQGLKADVETIQSRQHGGLWTWIVGLSALTVLVGTGVFVYVKSQE